MKSKIKLWIPYVIIALFFILTIIINLAMQGITCNDEVQLRLYGQQGIGYFLKRQIIHEDIYQGRILGAIGNIKFLSFISDNIYMSRSIQILFILIAFGLFGKLVDELCQSKGMGILGFVMALAFLPITFEHSVPNAFVIVVCQPLICLLISFILFIKYIENGKKLNNIFCCIFFFWGCCLYEFVVTYVLAFPIICLILYLRESDSDHNVWMCIKKSYGQVITSIIYLILYLLQGKVFPTSYSGTTINLSEPSKIFNVLKTECLSAVPGYYLFNEKYKYLYSVYQIKNQKIFEVFILFIFVVTFGFIIFCVLTNEKKGKCNSLISLVGGVTVFLYTIIPTIPNSITSLYQDSVSETYFTSIPVSLFLYLAMIFLIVIIIHSLIDKAKFFILPITLILLVLGVNIQYTNRKIADEQYSNYERFTSIEDLLRTAFWEYQGDMVVEAPSLYETKNNLAIEGGHWTSFISLYCNNDIQICEHSNDAQAYVQIQDDNSFYIIVNGEEYYATKEMINDIVIVKDEDNKNKVMSVGDITLQSNSFNFYRLYNN